MEIDNLDYDPIEPLSAGFHMILNNWAGNCRLGLAPCFFPFWISQSKRHKISCSMSFLGAGPHRFAYKDRLLAEISLVKISSEGITDPPIRINPMTNSCPRYLVPHRFGILNKESLNTWEAVSRASQVVNP